MKIYRSLNAHRSYMNFYNSSGSYIESSRNSIVNSLGNRTINNSQNMIGLNHVNSSNPQDDDKYTSEVSLSVYL